MLFAALNIVLAYLQDTLNPETFYYAILVSFWFLLSTHVFRFFILKWNWLDLKIKQIWLKLLISLALLAMINFMVHLMFLTVLGILIVLYDLDPFNIGVTLLSTFSIYFVWTLFYFIYHYFEKYNAALKYEALKNEIELNNLKSQLNPHFIFNALNSIRALVDENPEKSKDAITHLSSILRSSLVANKNKLTSFEEEFHAVKDYLNLESIRYEERLKTHFQIDPKSMNFAVPPMMVQTLVENGIKHGIAKLKEGGSISLDTKVEDNTLIIKIRNNGQLEQDEISLSKGFGIANTRQRLQLLYGEKALFSIENEDSNTVLTKVCVPKRI